MKGICQIIAGRGQAFFSPYARKDFHNYLFFVDKTGQLLPSK